MSAHTVMAEEIARAIEIVGGAAPLAKLLSVTTQAVCFWRDGKRRFPEALGARLEEVTGGAVSRRRLWPTRWHLIWPELIGTTGAPEVPATVATREGADA